MIQNILDALTPYILPILGTILTTVASYVGLKLKAVYEKKINTEQKKEIVNTVVKMVEQIAKSKGWTSEEKFAEAKKNALQWLNNIGIKVTDIELEALIESTVNSFTKSVCTQTPETKTE